MRIISQDKSYSFEFSDHDIRQADEYLYCVTVTRDVVIGKYDSEYRASEIFEMIHDEAKRENVNISSLKVFRLPEV